MYRLHQSEKSRGVYDRKCIVFLCALVLKCLRQVMEDLHLYYNCYNLPSTYKWPPKSRDIETFLNTV